MNNSIIWSRATVSLEFLTQIIDHVGHPIFVKDKRFRFVLVNKAFCAFTGKTPEQLLGRTDYDFFSQDEADAVRMKDIELFSTGQSTESEEFLTQENITRRVLSVMRAPLKDQDGKIGHIVGIAHDITERKLAEASLRITKDELEHRVQERTAELQAAQQQLVRKERLAVLGRLSGGLAHQIRNPLSAIKTATYVLNSTLAQSTDTRVKTMLAAIHDEVNRANQFITDLLDYARVKPATRRPITIAELVEDVLRVANVPKNVHVVKDFDHLPKLSIDKSQLESAMLNLVRNACEAMKDMGTLTIRGFREKDKVKLLVEDSGPGLSLEMRKRLFEPLVTDKPGGTGLGLATALALIENQGGTLECERSTRQGTRFAITLPIA